jgi:hypothetical protein
MIPKTGTPSQGNAPPLVVIGRLLLLLLAVAAVAAAFVLSRADDRAAGSFGGPYACPMHPEVTSRAPGECPICRMALERVSASRRDASADAESADYSFPESANRPNYKLIVSANRRAFPRTVRAPAWVEAGGVVAAILYKDEAMGLVAGEPGQFFPAAAPAAGVDVRLTAEPPAPWDSSSSRLAFRVAPGGPALRVGEVGWVQLAARSQDLLAVPASAVLVSPKGPCVFVAAPDGRTFTRRSLKIGQVLSGFAVIVSGLAEGERVVVGNVFFLNAESRLSELAEASGVMP